MRVLVTASARFAITPDGILCTPSGSLTHRFWSRYLDVYDEVQLMVRAKPVASVPESWVVSSGPGVTPAPLPYYEGPWQYVKTRRSIVQAIRGVVTRAEAIHFRLPCSIGSLAWDARDRGHPYGVEVVTDPYDVFAPRAVRHPLRRFFRWYFPWHLRRQVASATAVAYVTQFTLQQRYPAAAGAFTTGYSSIELGDEAFVSEARPERSGDGPFTLVFVGSLAQLYKAPDVLIDAVGQCVSQGLDVRLVMVGDGKYRAGLQAQAARLGLNGHVTFTGEVPGGAAVREKLDQADLFVLPSQVEGLPRAMVEAMARALPCVGTRVGGIPELLTPEDTVPPGDATALADQIADVARNPARQAEMSMRNLAKAREYHDSVLRQRRKAFYAYVREQTEQWLGAR
jgi:glycosyltransferase involved in cell wall biosynthesis